MKKSEIHKIIKEEVDKIEGEKSYKLTPLGKELYEMCIHEESLEVLFELLKRIFETDPEFDPNEDIIKSYLNSIRPKDWDKQDINWWINKLKKLRIIR